MIIVGVSISNFIDDEVKKEMANDPKVQAIAKEWSVAANNLLDLCRTSDTSEDTLVRLQNCKTDIQSLSNDCNEQVVYSKTDFCLNTDFQKLDKSFDQRITIVEEKIEALQTKISTLKEELGNMEPENTPSTASDIFELTNQKMIAFFDGCMINNDEDSKKDCSETAKQMISLCANTSVNACNDPRLEEIANWGSNQNIEQQIEPPKLNRECQPDRLCVKPGDYLQYSFESPSYMEGKGVLTYYFKDYLDDDNISVQLVYVSDEGNRHEKIRTMNLVTGLLNEEPQGGDISVSSNTIPYALDKISPVNLSYENLPNVEITEKKFPGWYGGSYDRDTVFFESKDAGDFSVNVFVDKETRVIILSQEYTYGGYLVKNDVLKDTNIFPK